MNINSGKFKRACFSVIVFFIAAPPSISGDEFLDMLFANSHQVWNNERTETGMYRRNNGNQTSSAVVGWALISHCAADALGIEDDSEDKVLLTLRALAGRLPGFRPPVDPQSGFWKHFFSTVDGSAGSNYSTIDTSILLCGVLFAKRYFHQNAEITELANELYNQVNWDIVVTDASTGQVSMLVENGQAAGSLTRPTNEYGIVAWLAAHGATDSENQTVFEPWRVANKNSNHSYEDIDLLYRPSAPSFMIQFEYFLVHDFTVDPLFAQYMRNRADADRLRFQLETDAPPYVWGTGASETPDGYEATDFESNVLNMVNPPIQAGFLPVYPELLEDLRALWEDGRATIQDGDVEVMWAYSLEEPNWTPSFVGGVDWGPMPLGLAGHPELLGPEWFATYNDFFNPEAPTSIPPKAIQNFKDGEIVVSSRGLSLQLYRSALVKVDLYSSNGKHVSKVKNDNPVSPGFYQYPAPNDLPNGRYFYKVTIDGVSITHVVLL